MQPTIKTIKLGGRKYKTPSYSIVGDTDTFMKSNLKQDIGRVGKEFLNVAQWLPGTSAVSSFSTKALFKSSAKVGATTSAMTSSDVFFEDLATGKDVGYAVKHGVSVAPQAFALGSALGLVGGIIGSRTAKLFDSAIDAKKIAKSKKATEISSILNNKKYVPTTSKVMIMDASKALTKQTDEINIFKNIVAGKTIREAELIAGKLPEQTKTNIYKDVFKIIDSTDNLTTQNAGIAKMTENEIAKIIPNNIAVRENIKKSMPKIVEELNKNQKFIESKSRIFKKQKIDKQKEDKAVEYLMKEVKVIQSLGSKQAQKTRAKQVSKAIQANTGNEKTISFSPEDILKIKNKTDAHAILKKVQEMNRRSAKFLKGKKIQQRIDKELNPKKRKSELVAKQKHIILREKLKIMQSSAKKGFRAGSEASIKFREEVMSFAIKELGKEEASKILAKKYLNSIKTQSQLDKALLRIQERKEVLAPKIKLKRNIYEFKKAISSKEKEAIKQMARDAREDYDISIQAKSTIKKLRARFNLPTNKETIEIAIKNNLINKDDLKAYYDRLKTLEFGDTLLTDIDIATIGKVYKNTGFTKEALGKLTKREVVSIFWIEKALGDGLTGAVRKWTLFKNSALEYHSKLKEVIKYTHEEMAIQHRDSVKMVEEIAKYKKQWGKESRKDKGSLENVFKALKENDTSKLKDSELNLFNWIKPEFKKADKYYSENIPNYLSKGEKYVTEMQATLKEYTKRYGFKKGVLKFKEDKDFLKNIQNESDIGFLIHDFVNPNKKSIYTKHRKGTNVEISNDLFHIMDSYFGAFYRARYQRNTMKALEFQLKHTRKTDYAHSLLLNMQKNISPQQKNGFGKTMDAGIDLLYLNTLAIRPLSALNNLVGGQVMNFKVHGLYKVFRGLTGYQFHTRKANKIFLKHFHGDFLELGKNSSSTSKSLMKAKDIAMTNQRLAEAYNRRSVMWAFLTKAEKKSGELTPSRVTEIQTKIDQSQMIYSPEYMPEILNTRAGKVLTMMTKWVMNDARVMTQALKGIAKPLSRGKIKSSFSFVKSIGILTRSSISYYVGATLLAYSYDEVKNPIIFKHVKSVAKSIIDSSNAGLLLLLDTDKQFDLMTNQISVNAVQFLIANFVKAKSLLWKFDMTQEQQKYYKKHGTLYNSVTQTFKDYQLTGVPKTPKALGLYLYSIKDDNTEEYIRIINSLKEQDKKNKTKKLDSVYRYMEWHHYGLRQKEQNLYYIHDYKERMLAIKKLLAKTPPEKRKEVETRLKKGKIYTKKVWKYFDDVSISR